jgi:hypothetical protein
MNTKRTPIEIGELLPIVSRRLMKSIVTRTPIDTGAAKAHWEFSRSGSNYIMINNPLPYIARLDNGWSKQAPAPLGITIFVARHFASIVKDSVQDWLQ